jgi:non-ribosomal peptide synthetase component F
MNMLFLTLYGILLHKYCRQEEIPVGIIALGRNHADLGNVMGIFCNYLPCKICVFPEKSVPEHFAR